MPDTPPVEPVAPVEPPAEPPTEPPVTLTIPPDLGDAGKQAIDRMKAERNDAQAALKAAQAELEALRVAQMSEQERAIAVARAEAADEARTAVLGDVNRRLFAAELRAAAGAPIPTTDGKHVRITDSSLLADPEVAVRLLGLGEIPVTDSGDINTEAISDAVAAFVASRPYLTASATPPAGSADQGTRTPPPVLDLNAQIVEAEAAGDWGRASALKLQKLAAAQRP